jgi:hypothetical protein
MEMLGGQSSAIGAGANSGAAAMADGASTAMGGMDQVAGSIASGGGGRGMDFTKILGSLHYGPGGGPSAGESMKGLSGNNMDPLGLFGGQQQPQKKKDEGASLDIGAILGAAALLCWVARAVYGEWNPSWLMFRHWVVTEAPVKFQRWYIERGEKYAEKLKSRPDLVAKWMKFMDSKINK